MNFMNHKLNNQNQNSLQESLSRDINYALQNKPSLDALNNINNTIVDKPFLDQGNLKLDISNNLLGKNNISQLVNQQMGNLKNEVLQSNTVSQVVQMNYHKNNNGNIEQLNIKSNDGKNFHVQHKKTKLPHPDDPIIKSFTISLNDLQKGDLWETIEPPKPLLLNAGTQEEVYNGVKSVNVSGEVEKREESNGKLERSFNDIMNNVKSNKILTFGFLLLVIIIIYLIRNKKILGK